MLKTIGLIQEYLFNLFTGWANEMTGGSVKQPDLIEVINKFAWNKLKYVKKPKKNKNNRKGPPTNA